MSDRGAYKDDGGTDMTRRGRDQEHERMLEGGTDPAFDAFADALRSPDEIDPTLATAHIAAAASLARETPAPVTDRSPVVAFPWYRRVVVRGAGLGLTAKLLLGGAVAVAATGGAAAGGILPDPVQGVIADTVSHVGIHIPNPRLTTTTIIAASTTTTVAPSTTTIASGANDGDDDGDVVVSGATPGTYRWDGTACDATPIAVRYTVTGDGDLELVSVLGEADDIDSDDDRIRVDFDGVRVDIRIVDDTTTVDEDRDCGAADDESGGDGDDGSTTTTTTQPDDDDNGDSSGGSDDDGDDDGDDHSSGGSGDDGDDPDDGSGDDSAAGSDDDDTSDGPTPGAYNWSSTSCAGDPISVSYTVTGSGTLVLGSITGDVASVDEDDDEIDVLFTDGVEVDISIDGGAIVHKSDCDDD